MHMCKLGSHLFSCVCNSLLIESVNLEPVDLWRLEPVYLKFPSAFHCTAPLVSSSGLGFCTHLFKISFYFMYVYLQLCI